VEVPFTWKPTGWFMVGWSAEDLRERVEKEFLTTLWDDLEIWRYQVYVEHPALAKQDARPYGSIRRWARQFYEIDPA
jgi:3-ketosteroid 9alpha-monooxygenase subunit A